MYIKSYDNIPLWAWGLDTESLSEILDMERIEIKYPTEEIDLLCDFDFLYNDL